MSIVPPIPTFKVAVVVIPDIVKEVREPIPPITLFEVVAVPVRFPTKVEAVTIPVNVPPSFIISLEAVTIPVALIFFALMSCASR